MATLTFRGAHIRFVDLRIKDEAGVFCRLMLTADMTDPVIEAMGWERPPECADSIKLSGGLSSRTLILTPNDKALRNHEIQIECSEVSDFQFFRVDGGEDKPQRTELRFIARSSQAGAVALLENYLRLVGQAPGAMQVAYETQEKMDFSKSDPVTKCPACVAGTQKMHNDDAVHVDGSKCLDWEDSTDEPESSDPAEEAESEAAGPVLASARELGGTHQKKRGRSAAGVQ